MHKPDFWTSYAEAMELSVEGNRLIAREIGEFARELWRRVAVGGYKARQYAQTGGADNRG